MYLEVYIKWLKEPNAGNCKNVCLCLEKELQKFKNYKKENKKFEA